MQLPGPLFHLHFQAAVHIAFFLDQPQVSADLVDQLVIINRFEQVICRTDFITPLLKLVRLVGCRQEDNRDIPGPLPTLSMEAV